MRIRILKPFFYLAKNRHFNPGDVADIPEDEAKIWLEEGMAMQDKSLDGGTETKAGVPARKPEVIPPGHYWCGKCETLHRETSRLGKRHLKHKV
jgi:hypothetical protein